MASRMWEETKHVVGKVLKIGLIGALIGGVVLGLPAILAGGSIATVGSGLVGLVSTKAAATVAAFGAKSILGAALPGLMLGGGIGAAIGLVKGVSGAGEAADDAQSAVVERQERALALAERQASLMEARQAAMGGGLTPGGMPMGKGQGLHLG